MTRRRAWEISGELAPWEKKAARKDWDYFFAVNEDWPPWKCTTDQQRLLFEAKVTGRARYKALAEMRATAAHFDAEIADLQHDYRELALELHRDRYDRALDEAIFQRAMSLDALLH